MQDSMQLRVQLCAKRQSLSCRSGQAQCGVQAYHTLYVTSICQAPSRVLTQLSHNQESLALLLMLPALPCAVMLRAWPSGPDQSLATPQLPWSLYPSRSHFVAAARGGCTWSVRPSIWALEGSFSCSRLLMRDTLLPPDPPGGPSRPEGLLVSWSLEDRTVLGVLGAFPVADARLESLAPMRSHTRPLCGHAWMLECCLTLAECHLCTLLVYARSIE